MLEICGYVRNKCFLISWFYSQKPCDWEQSDFYGQYHIFKIESRFPVPGAALVVDHQKRAKKEVRQYSISKTGSSAWKHHLHRLIDPISFRMATLCCAGASSAAGGCTRRHPARARHRAQEQVAAHDAAGEDQLRHQHRGPLQVSRRCIIYYINVFD